MIAHLRARDADAAVQWLVHHLDAVSKKLQDIVARADEATPA
jgi:DNA-binding GntR family transcriptional regulator